VALLLRVARHETVAQFSTSLHSPARRKHAFLQSARAGQIPCSRRITARLLMQASVSG